MEFGRISTGLTSYSLGFSGEDAILCLHCHSLVALSGREGCLPHPHTSPCHHHEKNPTGT